MGAEEEGWGGWAPAPGGGGPLYIQNDHWTHFDNSVNAVSFGFVATAILISMFLVMAIFEKFLRNTSPAMSPENGFLRRSSDVEAQHQTGGGFSAKLGYPSPKMSANAKEVSVLMPGNNVPTFIAHPAPVPCPPERKPWPLHQQPSNFHSPSTSAT